MMLLKRTRIRTLLCAAVFLHVAVAGVIAPHHRRQDTTTSPTTAITTEAPATTATSEGQDGSSTASPENSATRSSSVDGTTSMTSTTSIASDTPTPSAINGNNPNNNSIYTTTIAPGDLPLQPVLTPGWGVAGAILMLTGIVYGLIGIKNAWLHTFFSAAYLASLSVTVLIIYVMVPPVPVAIQGAYVVAIVCTGLIIGGAATLFRELTEGLGCLLGGFCVGMWLLTLRDGGLVQSGNSKIIFILVFTIAGYGLYFSRFTRPYALIGMMSFAGATATVLGIDCFSLAGLKEFWAYIWNLNDKVFPFGADTYPMTKGVRVEVALIVVITILGVISQLKLWRVIQQHRTKRAEARAEAQRHRDEEEANVGRQVEEETARERQEWENVYGDRGRATSSCGSGDSGVGVDPEKADKFDETQTTIKRVSSDKDEVEMEELPSSRALETPEAHEEPMNSTNGLMVTDNEESRVTVRVAHDEVPNNEDELVPMPEPDEKEWMSGTEGESRRGSVATIRHSYQFSRRQTLEITPLPFQIPDLSEEGEEKNADDRSSFATFADEDDRSKRASMGSFLMNRLSANSGNLLRNLSQRSRKSKRKTGEFEQSHLSREGGESVEVLVPREQRANDAESVAATIDGMSAGANTALGLSKDGEKRWTMMDIQDNLRDPVSNSELDLEVRPSGNNFDPRHFSTADTVAVADAQEASALGDPAETKSKRESTLNGHGRSEETATAIDALGTNNADKSGSPASISASSVSLTKDRLPPALPRVALSYRTNEWAKHLGLAEAPEMDTLQLNEYPSREHGSDAGGDADAAVPVNVEELQQTAETGIPPTTICRSESSPSMSLSRGHVPPAIIVPTEGSLGASAQTSPVKTISPQPPRANSRRQSSSDTYTQPIREEEMPSPDHLHHPLSRRTSRNSTNSSASLSPPAAAVTRPPVPGVVSYSSPQTLLGQREVYLRNKSQAALFTPSSGLEPTPLYAHAVSQLDVLNSKHADDLPLSQRKEFLRQSSLPLPQQQQQRPNSSTINFIPQQLTRLSSVPTPLPVDALPFDSHQPQRYSAAAPRASREARLANFRQSVAAELRTSSSASLLPSQVFSSPFQAQPPHASTAMNGGEELLMNRQRDAMLSQREYEAQRREAERRGREQAERAFEERMRRGELMDAHRDAMRRMQGSVRER
ncbi:hypothetical protein F4775DRAFT_598008 [Biscogniauxia sp. FL1348]|nr:hypothetical protein F4775DRAFT_598008 [Biscogniauxia sp. FL1348]